MRRSDLQGWWQALGVIAYLTGTALLTYHFFARQQWALFAVALFAYGTYSCFLGAASHELDHGHGVPHQGAEPVLPAPVLADHLLQSRRLRAQPHLPSPLHAAPPMATARWCCRSRPRCASLFIIQLFCVNLTGGPGCDGLIPRVRDTVNSALGKPRGQGTPAATPSRWRRALTSG